VVQTFRQDGSVNVIVESPRGSTIKLKFDPDTKLMTLVRPLPAGIIYPFDWGFIPSTRAADGDPLDAFIVWDSPSYPGVVVACRAIGILKVEQTNPESRRRERNDRIAVLPLKSPRQDAISSVFDLSERVRSEIERFFENAVAFEGKEVKLLGWDGPDAADAPIRAAAGHVGSSS
jgi:inorganic pyrophosphatase